jgi:cell wall-associated NlpC family hydrolase
VRHRTRASIRLVTRILAVPAALLVTLPAAAPVLADPKLADVERQLTQVGETMEQATEQYNDARVDLKASQGRQAVLTAQAGTVRQKLGKYRAQVEAYAALAYRGDMSSFGSVLTSGSPQDAMDQLSYLKYLSSQHSTELNALLDAQRELAAAQAKIDHEVAEQVKQENILRSKRTKILADAARWEALRKKLAPHGSPSGPPPIYQGNAVGRARTALKYAYAQIGKPYVWGAAGPSYFDCSGLTLMAWARAGISMPHSAHRQFAMFPKVPRSKLQPGDLVFFYSDIHHVGIYIGGGQMIHAPTTGQNVQIGNIGESYRHYYGAVRPF